MIPFSPPRIDQEMIDAVDEVLRSGWISTGPVTKAFEKELTAYTGAATTLCVSSATAGMELMLRWFGVGEGDEVIIPAYTYCATANVVMHTGARPVMCDVGDDFNMDVKHLANLINERTKVIMPVDIGGWPCDYDAINVLVNSPQVKALFGPVTEEQQKLGRILVLADAAHSLGAKYKGRNSGSLADISVFSFHAVKNLTTAEGGAVCLNLPEPFDNEALYKYFCVNVLHGQSKDALAKTKLGGWRYDVVEPGYKCNMTDIQAALGRVELARYDADMLVKRKAIFDRYTTAFSEMPELQTPLYESDEVTSSYHVYMLRIPGADEATRDEIIKAIYEEKVAVNVHFQPLPLLTAYKTRGYRMEDYPNAYRMYSGEISLPVFYNLTEEQQETVIRTVKMAVSKLLHQANA